MNEWEWQLLEDKTPIGHLEIAGVQVRAGDRVQLHPRKGGDVLDIALAGQTATIEALEQDYEGKLHVCVVLDNDPGRDMGLLRQPGHRFFFDADEVEPLPKQDPAQEEHIQKPTILVAGIGNIFLGDDGFGVEVVRRLATRRIPAGVRVAEPAVSLTEVAATLMELLPARSSIAFPGPSLAPLWRGAGSPADYPHPLARLAQFSFALLNGIPSYAGASLSVVSPEWHYMLHEATGDELYNWRQDSGEQTNLRSTAQGQPLAREFHKEAERRGALPFGAQGRKME